MIGEITPLVQRAGRRIWIMVVTWHIAGATLSAALLGLVLSTCGLVFGVAGWKLPLSVVVGGAMFFCALRDMDIGRWPLPSLRRQTPAWLPRVFGNRWGVFTWGADLGQGWTTYVSFAGYYGLVLWAFVAGQPAQAVVILGSYGAGRALPVLVAGFVGHDYTLARVHQAHMYMLHAVNAIALAVVAGYLLSRGIHIA